MDKSDGFGAAKLRDHVRGEIGENEDFYHHTGLVSGDALELMSFMEGIYEGDHDDLPADFQQTRVAKIVRRSGATRHIGQQISDHENYAVGVTEQDVDISQAQAFGRLQESNINERAPYICVMFGAPNKGKTSLALLILELWRELAPTKYEISGDYEPAILTNASSISAATHIVQDITRFKELVFGSDQWFESDGEQGEPPEIEPERPKFWLFDECSTHLDARTNAHEVSTQYLPLVKRFAKVNLDSAHLGHSGMDIHKDLRRSLIATEFIFKTGKKTADVYADMHEDSGTNKKYELTEIPDTSISYSPDDFAPFSWR